MKKVLLATTILALSAPLALAEVTVSGDGRMGVTYTEGAVNELAFTSRIRVAFTASGETDGGLSFGGTIRADNAAAGAAGTAGNVFISGAFGKISMGDVAGAAEFVVGDLHGVGLTGLGDTNEFTYLSNSGAGVRPTARYEYSTGGLTVAVSVENPGFPAWDVDWREGGRRGTGWGPDKGTRVQEAYSVGVKYAMDGYAFSLGYESQKAEFCEDFDFPDDVNCDYGYESETVGHVIGAVEGTFNDVTLKAIYGRASKIDFTQYGISASYKMDALGLSAYHRVVDVSDVQIKYTGIGASYDLGGGASVVGGIVSVNPDGVGSTTLADVGVKFAF